MLKWFASVCIRLISKRFRFAWSSLSVGFLLAVGGCTDAENTGVPILRLSRIVDGVTASTLTVLSEEIDPNSHSVTGTTILADGDTLKGLSNQYALGVAANRRVYSYDAFTAGISDQTSTAICRLGGPAVGWMLETRYVAYSDGYEIIENGMRVVLAEAENCLYTRDVHPVNRQSHVAATRAMAELRAILQNETNGLAYPVDLHPCNSTYVGSFCED